MAQNHFLNIVGGILLLISLHPHRLSWRFTYLGFNEASILYGYDQSFVGNFRHTVFIYHIDLDKK